MNPSVSKRPSRGPKLKEVIAVVVVLGILAFFVLSALSAAKRMARMIACTNHVKQIGLAARIFASDNGGRFAMEIPVNDGGTKELAGFGVVVPHLQEQLTYPGVAAHQLLIP
jgi:hypothetical protein